MVVVCFQHTTGRTQDRALRPLTRHQLQTLGGCAASVAHAAATVAVFTLEQTRLLC